MTLEQNESRTEEFAGLVESLNERLRSSGAGGAESAFGLGCGIGLLPVVGITLLLWIFGVVNLILGMMMLVVGLLALAGLSIMLANLARSNAVKRVYWAEVEPEIVQYLSQQRLSRQDFDTAACRELPVDAPLQRFLHPAVPEDAEASQEQR